MRRTKQKQIWNAAAVLLTVGLLTVVLSSGALASTACESRIAGVCRVFQIPSKEELMALW